MKKSSDTMTFKEIHIDDFEKVVEVVDEEAGLHAIIALHNTTLGPALGGIRAYDYKSFDEALEDVLRLAKGMTRKAAIVEMGTGGGKSVIITDIKGHKPKKLLLAFAEAINYFKGHYIGAEDVGMSIDDLAIIRQGTRYAVGLPHPESSGDPSWFTARGGYKGIQAVCRKLWGSDSIAGKRIAIQGLGAAGMKLAQFLFWEGANLIVSDLIEERALFAAKQFGAEVAASDEIHAVECDIFAPCAMGAILNHTTIPELNCSAVAGSANNQLATDADGAALQKRGILYAPDYVINGGGLINVCSELEEKGYDPKLARDRLDHIYTLLLTLFTLAEEKQLPTDVVANDLVEYNLSHGIGKRTEEMIFHH